MRIFWHRLVVASLFPYFAVPFFLGCIKNHTPSARLSQATMVPKQFSYLAVCQQKQGQQESQAEFRKWRILYSFANLVQRMCQDFFFAFDGGFPFLSLNILTQLRLVLGRILHLDGWRGLFSLMQQKQYKFKKLEGRPTRPQWAEL